MHTQKLVLGHLRRVDIPEHIEEPGCNQPVFYCCETPGILRVAFAGVMLTAFRVTDVGGMQV